ncbi:hypothetical protein LO763_00635 [Glycomyces sp. A-F 0318]|uniref:hypothetical protein n=1 Tax=Glycomyces amatae TaxID=2881355 RepID=UPI001E5759A4|nr:hypothetical protein [Glycomyces amatae]MCD0442131.1 hypothetical protein [Glycomyces amatae]
MAIRQRALTALMAGVIAVLALPAVSAAAEPPAEPGGEAPGDQVASALPGDSGFPDAPGQVAGPPADPRYPQWQEYSVMITQSSANEGTSRDMGFEGHVLWNHQGGYRIVGDLAADCRPGRGGPFAADCGQVERTVGWIEYRTEGGGGWQRSPWTECRDGRCDSIRIDVTGTDPARESLSLRLVTWTEGTWDWSGTYERSLATTIRFS